MFWSVISFFFVVVVPVCAAAALVNRWLWSISLAQDGLESAAAIRHAARDITERLKYLELMLGNEGRQDNAGDRT